MKSAARIERKKYFLSRSVGELVERRAALRAEEISLRSRLAEIDESLERIDGEVIRLTRITRGLQSDLNADDNRDDNE